MRDEIILKLRGKLTHFINRREKAYEAISKRGIIVPDYATKKRAINSLRVQLEASKTWNLRSHVLWICAMRKEIVALLPYEFHDDPAQVTYRNRIRELLTWCDDQVHAKPLFNNLNQPV